MKHSEEFTDKPRSLFLPGWPSHTLAEGMLTSAWLSLPPNLESQLPAKSSSLPASSPLGLPVKATEGTGQALPPLTSCSGRYKCLQSKKNQCCYLFLQLKPLFSSLGNEFWGSNDPRSPQSTLFIQLAMLIFIEWLSTPVFGLGEFHKPVPLFNYMQ